MKMGASKPILGNRQTIQNIDFFNSIRTKLPLIVFLINLRFYLLAVQ